MSQEIKDKALSEAFGLDSLLMIKQQGMKVKKTTHRKSHKLGKQSLVQLSRELTDEEIYGNYMLED